MKNKKLAIYISFAVSLIVALLVACLTPYAGVALISGVLVLVISLNWIAL